MALTILEYAPQRQMLPLINSLICSRDCVRPSFISATADMICPEVQYPHWKPSCFIKASCMGCNWSPVASPSIVVTFFTSLHTARLRQELIGIQFTSTVQ